MTSPEKEVLGLDRLSTIDRVVVSGPRTEHPKCKYVVSSEDEGLLYAREDCGLVNKVLAGKSRALQIDVLDTNDVEVIKLRRPYSVGEDKMEVWVCGNLSAVVRKEVTFCKPVLTISDPGGRQLLRIKGPVSTTSQCDFELYSNDKKRIGAICKRWNGATRGSVSDHFVIHFPQLDPLQKAAVIGTCFLIDFLYYDN